MDEIMQQLKNGLKKKFVVVEFRNGHRHTIKAYGEINKWVGSRANGIKNQIDYIRYVEQNEHTDLYDVQATDSESRAKDLEIIDEDGGFI